MKITLGQSLAFGCAVGAIMGAQPAWAQQRAFDVPAQDARQAIPEFARQAGLQISAPTEKVRGVSTNAIKGSLDARAALREMIAPTGLSIVSDDGTMIVLRYTKQDAPRAKLLPAAYQDGLRATSDSAVGVDGAASSDPSASEQVEEVIVTAQRRAQNIQDVPASITAVSGRQLEELNIFKLEDVAQLAPGLTLESGGAFGSIAQLRGVGFNSRASAAPAVDVYINDTPVDANYAFQAIYDVGQIEVLRGPQGTLRGRPAPAGAITITTRRADMSEFGGSVSTSFSDQNATNIEAAVNIPLIRDVLALRLSGLYDENDGNGVRGVNADLEDNRQTESWRASMRWAPTNSIDINLTHQRLSADWIALDWVQGPGAQGGFNGPANYNGPAIALPQRLSVQEGPSGGTQVSEITTLQARWELPGHRLTYSGAIQDNHFSNVADQDPLNAVVGFAPNQTTTSTYKLDSHEIIFSSTGEDRFIDYTLGAWYQKNETASVFSQFSALPGAFGSPISPSGTGAVNGAYLLPVSGTIPTLAKNHAVFANLTFHVAPATELTVGVRYLEDRSTRSQTLNLGGALVAVPVAFACGFVPGAVGSTYPGTCNFAQPASSVTQDGGAAEREFVYNASLKHDFTNDFMGYVSYGHSFRPAGVSTGITAAITEDLIQGESETSDSYEVGFKSQWMDRRLRLNGAVFHQSFENFIGKFLDVPFNAGASTQSGGFTYPGDAKVGGAELELAYDFTDDWSASLNASVTDGKYDNARVPCRDTDGDGVPDAGPTQVAPFLPGESVRYCVINDSISTQAPWSLTLQSEYNFPIMGTDAYVRGLFTYFGENDNIGPGYIVPSYGLLNLYVGTRSEEKGWDLSVWAKNLLDDDTITNFPGSLGTYGGVLPQVVPPTASFQPGYRLVNAVRPREIGVTMRYAFAGG